ncbi:MAG: twin-arginine translocase TatA/TatE family subunit [Chloroflexota bacterium]
MNILGMGPMELLLIVVLALIVFGPAKLPEIMAQVGKAIGDFRRATSELSDEFNRTIQSELQETRAVVDETKATFSDAKASVHDAHASVSSAIAAIPAPIRTAVPAANGTTPETRAETGTNGTAPGSSAPALADTTQWSWETSANALPVTVVTPPADTAGTPLAAGAASETSASEPIQAADPTAASTVESALGISHPKLPAPSPARDNAAHEDLVPPY